VYQRKNLTYVIIHDIQSSRRKVYEYWLSYFDNESLRAEMCRVFAEIHDAMNKLTLEILWEYLARMSRNLFTAEFYIP